MRRGRFSPLGMFATAFAFLLTVLPLAVAGDFNEAMKRLHTAS